MTEEDEAFTEIERKQAAQLAKLGWQYFECPCCGSEGAKAFPKTVQEPVAWKWHQAPIKTLWGHDMVVADLAIDKDNTVSVYCERDQAVKVEAMFTPLAAQPAKEKAPQSANCEAPGRISSDHARDADYKADQPVAVVSGYYGGQCVVLPTDPARLFNSGTAFYTTPPAATAQEKTTMENNGGKTGWPPGLLQDDNSRLSKWFAGKPDARQKVREAAAPVRCWKCGDMDAEFQACCKAPACGMKEKT